MVAVLLVVAGLVVVRLATPKRADTVASGSLATTVIQALSVAPAVLDRVGQAQGAQAGGAPVKLSAQPPLTADGKPLVLYIGAEYCPFCAAQRWALAVALSRFGTFTDLKAAHSASDDVFPSTATVSFHGATYDSAYLAFQGVETATSERRDGRYVPLQSLTPAQENVMRVYNAPPYIARESAGAVPFVDFGNQYLMSGAAFSPALLKGLTQEQIAAALSNPDSPVAKAVLGAANAMTGVLCKLTGGKPTAVCDGPAAKSFVDAKSG